MIVNEILYIPKYPIMTQICTWDFISDSQISFPKAAGMIDIPACPIRT